MVGDPDDVPVPKWAACANISEIVASADEYAGEYSFGVGPTLFQLRLAFVSMKFLSFYRWTQPKRRS